MATTVGPLTAKQLQKYGLESLAPWLAEVIISGMSAEEFELELFERPEFKRRFPAIELRSLAGLPPVSVDEYLAYENTMRNLSDMWDFPLSQEEINTALAMNLSAVEAEQRIGLAVNLVYESPIEDQEEASRLYGVSAGQMAKYWMDPTKQFGVLQQQLVASRIAGSALRSGFGQLTREEAERLGSLGVTPEAAQEGLGGLYRMRNLFTPMNTSEDEITRQQQLEALAGNAQATEAIETRQATRVAEFGGGGDFAAGGEGFKGTGSAKS